MSVTLDVATNRDAYDPSATIVSLFLGQVGARPDAVAVIEDSRRTSYRDLAGLAAGTGSALRRAGVARGARVGILSGRGTQAVAAQLGVLGLGAAFVPLDPGMPAAALAAVVAEAGLAAIACDPRHGEAALGLAAGACPVVALDAALADPAARLADPDAAPLAGDAAYVIYTSGSTGRPKGVVAAHRGVVRLVRGQDYADLGPDQVMLNMAAVGFDASIGEIYSAVLNGGTLAVLPDAMPSLDRIGAVIARDRVTIAYITAGLFHVIAEHRPEILAPLRQVLPCGDVLSERHVRAVRRALPHLRIVNGYGPTENTVFTCCHTVGRDWTGGPGCRSGAGWRMTACSCSTTTCARCPTARSANSRRAGRG